MIDEYKNLIKRLILMVYVLIFGKPPGPVAQKFIKNLTFIFTGLTVAKVISMVFQIYVGRSLGSIEYGKFALVNSMASLFWVPMLMGLSTAMVKYLAENKEEKKNIISTSISMMVIFITLSSIVLYIIFPILASAFSVSQKYILGSIALALLYCGWVISQKIYQGLEKMNKLSMANISFSAIILVLVSFLFLMSEENNSAAVALATMGVGYLLVSTLMLPELKKNFRPNISRKWASPILKYGFVGIIGTISLQITVNINHIFLNIFLTLNDVGLYQAYQFSTMTVASFFVVGFATVFFPAASAYKDKKEISFYMRRMLVLSPILFVAFSAISFTILFLYGPEYTIMPYLIISFAVAAVVVSLHSIYGWFASSIGMKGITISTVSIVITSIVNVAFAILLIPRLGIPGAVYSTIISYFMGLIITYSMLKRLLSSGHGTQARQPNI